jgi:hypothetical protein
MSSKARGLADLGNAFDDGALSNRNLIINGAMQVAQRGTSASPFGAPTYPSIDRYKCYKQSDGGELTGEQSTEAPSGFYFSMKTTVTSPDATTTGVNAISYWVEGTDVQHLGFGTSSAQTCTLSFWAKSSVTGTYSVVIQDNDYVVSYVAEYSISAANTWEHKVVTFVGPTTGSWGKTSATSGVRIWWDMGSADAEDASTTEQWSGRAFRSSSSVKLLENSGATFYLTGVQLEVGDTATPFEHQSYGDTLARCQRYYQTLRPDYLCLTRFNQGAGSAHGVIPLAVTMRASPSFSNGSGTPVTTNGYAGTMALSVSTPEAVTMRSNTIPIPANNTVYFYGGYLNYDAEL